MKYTAENKQNGSYGELLVATEVVKELRKALDK